jgi:hypothetical protein
MARPQVADGGDGLQIWRVPVHILNKQSRKPKRCGLPDSGLGEELRTHRKEKSLLQNVMQGLGTGQIL